MKKIFVVLCMAMSVSLVSAQGKFEKHNFSIECGIRLQGWGFASCGICEYVRQ